MWYFWAENLIYSYYIPYHMNPSQPISRDIMQRDLQNNNHIVWGVRESYEIVA